jgi:hypothetical protein
MPDLTVLDRPLKVSKSFVWRSWAGAVLFLAFGVAAGLGYPTWQAFEARNILADQALWARGLEAADGELSGRRTSHNFILNDYKLDVAYVDQSGTRHRGQAKFDLFLSSVADGAPVAVRYDPGAPDRFVLSWAILYSGGRWASVAFFIIVGMGIGVICTLAGRDALRRLAEARQAARDSDDIEIALESIVQVKQYGRSTGVVTYKYLVSDASGKPRKRSVSFDRRKQHTPIFLDPEKTRVLAVRPRSAVDRPIVLRSDFYPFDLNEGARQTALARLARARPA